MSKQSDWSVRVTRVSQTAGWLCYHATGFESAPLVFTTTKVHTRNPKKIIIIIIIIIKLALSLFNLIV